MEWSLTNCVSLASGNHAWLPRIMETKLRPSCDRHLRYQAGHAGFYPAYCLLLARTNGLAANGWLCVLVAEVAQIVQGVLYIAGLLAFWPCRRCLQEQRRCANVASCLVKVSMKQVWLLREK